MGDPVPVRVAGPRTVVRYCPIDAYSLAVACGSRGVSLDIWPASHSAPAVPRAVRLSRHDRDRSPSRTTRRATTWFPPRRLSPAGAGSLPRLGSLPGRRGPPPSARYRECGLRCHAMRRPRYAAALQQGTWSALSVLPSHAGLFVPATSPVATVIAGHLSTASSRGHQRSSYQSPWRDWPQGRFCAPSLPDPHQTASPRGPVVTGRRLHSAHHSAAHIARPTNTTTARIVVSLARVTSMSGRPGFAARRTLRPLSTAIRRASAALPGPSARTATCARGPPARRDRWTRSRPPPAGLRHRNRSR